MPPQIAEFHLRESQTFLDAIVTMLIISPKIATGILRQERRLLLTGYNCAEDLISSFLLFSRPSGFLSLRMLDSLPHCHACFGLKCSWDLLSRVPLYPIIVAFSAVKDVPVPGASIVVVEPPTERHT